MLRVGRPRSKNKDLPLGVYLEKGRFYVKPVNEEMRAIFRALDPARPEKKSHPLGADKDVMRKEWVRLFVRDTVPADDAKRGTCGELIERYEREYLSALDPKQKREQTRYCKNLKAWCGKRRYAKSEAEAGAAAPGTFVRSTDCTQYLRSEAKRQVFDPKRRLIADGRPVAANKEMKHLSRIFKLAKVEWGYTEYNPCLQVEYNPEVPRSGYAEDELFMRVYDAASATLQCMMDLAQMHGARRGMLIRATLACIRDDGLLLPLNKRKKTEVQRYQLIQWTDDLHAVIDRWLELRRKVRGGQRDVLDATTAPLFLTRRGKAFNENSFNIMWRRARAKAKPPIPPRMFTFHDIKAKSLSDSPDVIDAMNRGGHTDVRTAKRVYLRKPTRVLPLPRVSGKKH